MPLIIALNAIFFNLINGSINGYAIGQQVFDANFLSSWNVIIGLILFTTGYFINVQSDNILLSLRKPGESNYKIPFVGLYSWVSSPNYFGEIIEWIGFALIADNVAALSFAFWTIANLAPRSFTNHQWYHQHFSEYPKERKVLVPFIW